MLPLRNASRTAQVDLTTAKKKTSVNALPKNHTIMDSSVFNAFCLNIGILNCILANTAPLRSISMSTKAAARNAMKDMNLNTLKRFSNINVSLFH